MIAPANPKCQYDHDVVNEKFEQMLPRIRLMAFHAFRDKDGEQRNELAADVIARAYAAFVRLAQQGRAELGYATPLALFSIKQVKSGRRMGAKLNVKDVSSEYARLGASWWRSRRRSWSLQSSEQTTDVSRWKRLRADTPLRSPTPG